jgi:hypothetical protein
MADDSAGLGAIRGLVDKEWSVDAASSDPDDPMVRGFAEFGLPTNSRFATEHGLHRMQTWRDDLQLHANSAFVDSTLLLTVEALLGPRGPDVLTPVTLWELTAFIDALVCFDRLYCIANPVVDVSDFNRRLGADVLTAIPDPRAGTLRDLAIEAAANGLSDMANLWAQAWPVIRAWPGVWAPDKADYPFAQEVQAVVDGWRAVLGPDLPIKAPFNVSSLDVRLDEMMGGTSGEYDDKYDPGDDLSVVLIDGSAAAGEPGDDLPAIVINGSSAANDESGPRSIIVEYEWEQLQVDPIQRRLGVLIDATRLERPAAGSAADLPFESRERFAAASTYRTYVNQGIANALALPYLPSTLRMPFRKLFVERAAEVQDELVAIALADQVFARQQPSSPLILPFFSAAVLQRAAAREDVWTQMAEVRDKSTTFRRVRADLDRMLERSLVSPEALQIQKAIRDEALKLTDLAGAAQESFSVALGVVAQTGIVPLAGALKTGVDAAQGLGRGGSWTRIWRRLFHRHEYFLSQTSSQAIALTNALPQIQQLWQMPKIGGYLQRFASATQQMGQVLRD